MPVETVWAGIQAGLKDAHTDFDIRARMILDFDKPSGVEHAVAMAEFAADQDRDELVGLGADSVERDVDHRAFAPAFARARAAGLRRTIHAGEDGPADNIRVALDDLGAERIDHGFRLLDDDALTQRVVDDGIALTVCPTSNVVIANVVPDVAAHPFARQRERGVHVTINSDDPGMMRFDIADEYAAVWRAFGYSLEDMEQLALDGITASFAPPDEQRALTRRFESEFDTLRKEHGLPPREPTRR